MTRSMGSILIITAVLLAALNGWFFLQQPAMVFFPLRSLSATPADWGLAYEEVSLRSADGVALHGWYLPAPGAQKTLLFFHGNAGNISHRGESLAIFHRLGLNVLIVDYRGYGKSEGSPSEEGLHADAQAAWRFLREEKGVEEKDIVIFGRSLGGAVAARLAAEVKPAALILESSFSSARDVAGEVFPLLSKLLILRFGFNTAERIKAVKSPLLVLHSPDDEIIPYTLGERIYRAANEPKTLLRMQGDHNRGFLQSQPGYEQGIAAFLSRHVYSKAMEAPAEPMNTNQHKAGDDGDR